MQEVQNFVLMSNIYQSTTAGCAAGGYIDADHPGFCSVCPRGTYNEDFDQHTCTPCPEGQTTSEEDQHRSCRMRKNLCEHMTVFGGGGICTTPVHTLLVHTPPCPHPSLSTPLHVHTPPCPHPSLSTPLPVHTPFPDPPSTHIPIHLLSTPPTQVNTGTPPCPKACWDTPSKQVNGGTHNLMLGITCTFSGVCRNTLPTLDIHFLYHLSLKQSPVPCITMFNWFCQIELIESIWKKKAELRESSLHHSDSFGLTIQLLTPLDPSHLPTHAYHSTEWECIPSLVSLGRCVFWSSWLRCLQVN